MQNLATLINTQNTISTDDFLMSGQNYDSKNIAQKGKDFFNILNDKQNKVRYDTTQDNNKQTNKYDKNNEKSKTTDTIENNNTNRINNDLNEDKNTKPKNSNKDINQKNQETSDTQNIKENQTEQTQNTQDKTLDEVKSEPIIKETQDTAQGNNTQVLDVNTVIQDTVNKINNLIETTLDGQLNSQDVEALKGALEEIQNKIKNNELVVSEDTKQMLNEVLDRLLTQNPEDLKTAELQKDLKQLAQDISANSFKLDSQIKLEEENANPQKGIEINITKEDSQNTKETNKKEIHKEKNIQKTKNSETTVATTKDTKEIQNVHDDDIDIKQEMLDEMDVKVEEVSESKTNTNSQNQNFTTAQDEVIKLQIQNSDTDNNTPITLTFDKSIKNISSVNKTVQLEGIAKELNVNDILNQIGSKFEQLKDGATTKITMTLRPNELGRVTIELLSNANGISTNIIAQNSQVKELLDKNIDILKQQLAQHGLNVQNVQVKTVEQNSQAGLNNGYNERQNSQEGQGQEQSQNNKENNQNQHQQNKRETFKFNTSNVIENIDFDHNIQNATTSINTLRGKISYNL